MKTKIAEIIGIILAWLFFRGKIKNLEIKLKKINSSLRSNIYEFKTGFSQLNPNQRREGKLVEAWKVD